MLYRAVGAGAVLHTHSMAAALLSKIDAPRGHVVLSGWELLKGLDGITTHDCEVNLPIFPNSQDMRSLAALIEPRLAANQLCYGFLLAGHGLYAWGKDLQEAKRHLEVFEFLLRCEQEARRHGQPTSARQESVSYSGT
jgi:methylthioribulose-1-phosphate dehydratase